MSDRCWVCGEPWPCPSERISDYARRQLASRVVSRWRTDYAALVKFNRDHKQVPEAQKRP